MFNIMNVKILLYLLLLLSLCACSELKTITVRSKGKVTHRYEIFRKTKVQHGVERFYFANGKIDGELNYKNGLHHGDFFYYYEENGQLRQKGTFVEGKMEGMLYSYYLDGTLKEEVMNVNGVTEGGFKEYNPNGSLKAVGQYTTEDDEETLEQGLLLLYDENGVLIKKMICRTGQCCTIWLIDKGEVPPSSKLCEEIINNFKF